jgi:hypothetical protein
VFGRQIELVRLYYCVGRYGDVFLWPVRVPDEGERDNSYWETARLAAAKAMTRASLRGSLGARF